MLSLMFTLITYPKKSLMFTLITSLFVVPLIIHSLGREYGVIYKKNKERRIWCVEALKKVSFFCGQ